MRVGREIYSHSKWCLRRDGTASKKKHLGKKEGEESASRIPVDDVTEL